MIDNLLQTFLLFATTTGLLIYKFDEDDFSKAIAAVITYSFLISCVGIVITTFIRIWS